MSRTASAAYEPLAPRESAVYVAALAWLASGVHTVVCLRNADAALSQFEADKLESARQNLLAAASAIKWSGYIGVAVTLLLGIAVIRWQVRVYDNVVAFERQPAYSRSKSLWSWFIPFASLAWPFLSLRNLWNLSDPDVPESGARADRAPLLMAIWWATWLAYSFGANPIINDVGNAKTPADFHTYVTKMTWGLSAGLVACMLLIHVVRSFRPRQDACASRLFGPGATAVRGARSVGERDA